MSVRGTSATAGVLYLGISQVFLQLGGYGIQVVAARVLGPEGYGLYGVVFSAISLPVLITTSGLPQALSKFVSQNEARAADILRTTLRLQLGLAAAILAIVLLGAPVVASLLRDPDLVPYLRFAALSIPLYALYYTWASYLNGLRLFRQQSMVISLYAIGKFGVLAVLIGVIGVFGALAALILAPLIALALAWVIAPSIRPKGEALGVSPLVRFAAPFAAFAMATQFLSTLDLFMVKALIGDDTQVGIYVAASTLARVPFVGMTAIGLVMLPSIANSMQDGVTDKTLYLVRQTVRLVLLILGAGAALAVGSAQPLMTFIFSSAYADAGPVFAVLVLGTCALGLFYVLAHIVGGAGAPETAMRITLFAVPVGLVAGYFLIPAFGLSGAAWVVVVVGVLTALLAARTVLQRFGSLISRWLLLRLGLAASATAGGGLSLLAVGAPLLIVLPLLLAVYLALLILLREFNADDLREARGVLATVRSRYRRAS